MEHFSILSWAAWAAALALLPCRAEGVLRTAAEMSRYVDGEPTAPAHFAITATVIHAVMNAKHGEFIFVEDRTGTTRIVDNENPHPKPGDVIYASGQISFCPVGNAGLFTNNVISTIGHVAPPRPIAVPLSKLDLHRHNWRIVATEGTVVDVISDEISDDTAFLLLKDGVAKCTVALKKKTKDFDPLAYLAARVRVRGVFQYRNDGYRKYSGPIIVPDNNSDVTILVPPPKDPFTAPPIQHYPVMTPQEVAELPRRSEVGHVLATWNGNKFLMLTPKGMVVLVQMLDGVEPPRNGDAVKVVGYPTTDLFRINMTRAITRHEPGLAPFEEKPPETISPERLLLDGERPSPTAVRFYHGRAIRYRGVVKEAQGRVYATRLHLQTGQASTTVDAGASGLDIGSIPAGSEVEVTGVCVLEGENWTSERIFPHIGGLMLVLRTDKDIVVVRNPPWWTPRRLFTAILVILAGTFAVVLWNRYLNHVVNRRGGELAKERLKKESAQLKIGERTRLAVELHDSLSQNLEGVACQVAATRNIMQRDSATAASCLDTAQRMLDSCRLELRRCLFDLRGRALEENDLAAAIRTTLAPICEGVDLAIRFDIRRSHFDDTAVHATLCIIRELVSNAIRHGGATKVRVAGEYRNGELRFSVSDNGEGFDVANRAGTAQGHFGLDGVQERAERLDGSVDIESAPGRGTRATVALRIPQIGAFDATPPRHSSTIPPQT